MDPLVEGVVVYCLENGIFRAEAYTFQDRIPVNIYDGFQIDFREMDFLESLETLPGKQ